MVVLVAVYSAARVDGQVPTPESSPVASTSDADGAVAPAAAAIPGEKSSAVIIVNHTTNVNSD